MPPEFYSSSYAFSPKLEGFTFFVSATEHSHKRKEKLEYKIPLLCYLGDINQII